jgi:hypothetical protein
VTILTYNLMLADASEAAGLRSDDWQRHRASRESPAWCRICSAKYSASSNRSLKVVSVRRSSGEVGRLGFHLC